MERQIEWLRLPSSCFATLFPSETNSHVLDEAPWKQPLRWSIVCRCSTHLQKVYWDCSPAEGLLGSAHGRYP